MTSVSYSHPNSGLPNVLTVVYLNVHKTQVSVSSVHVDLDP